MPVNMPVILFDLDRTLLDTQLMAQLLAGHVESRYAPLGVAHGEFAIWNEQYKTSISSSRNYELSTLAAFIVRKLDPPTSSNGLAISLPTQEEIESDLTTFIQSVVQLCVYPDVLSSVQSFQQQGCTACLFTQGVTTWQELKIAHTKLSTLIDPALQFVSQDKTSAEHLAAIDTVLEQNHWQNRPLWLVDDKLNILQAAKNHWPHLKTFQILRTGLLAGEQLTETAGIVPLSSLSQLQNFLPKPNVHSSHSENE